MKATHEPSESTSAPITSKDHTSPTGCVEPLVSACIIARDEGNTIGPCIRSLRGLADEVVVVDTGSVDETASIASRLGARVYHHPWQEDFSLHRNQALSYAKGAWVLVIDADETVEPADFDETRTHLRSGTLPRVLMVRHWSEYSTGARVCEFLPRLFRRSDDIRYVHPVHEQLTLSGEEAVLSNLVIGHSGYADPTRLAQKQRRNLDIALGMADGEPHAQHCRMRAYVGLGNWEAAASAARALLMLPMAPPDLLFEAQVVVASSEFRIEEPDRPEFLDAVGMASGYFPHSSDVAYLNLMASAGRFLRALDTANRPHTDEFTRVGQFWHVAPDVRTLLAHIALPASALWRRGQVFPKGATTSAAHRMDSQVTDSPPGHGVVQ